MSAAYRRSGNSDPHCASHAALIARAPRARVCRQRIRRFLSSRRYFFCLCTSFDWKFLGMLLFFFFFWISIGKFLGIFPFFFSRNTFFLLLLIYQVRVLFHVYICDSVNINNFKNQLLRIGLGLAYDITREYGNAIILKQMGIKAMVTRKIK